MRWMKSKKDLTTVISVPFPELKTLVSGALSLILEVL